MTIELWGYEALVDGKKQNDHAMLMVSLIVILEGTATEIYQNLNLEYDKMCCHHKDAIHILYGQCWYTC
jgi:hypothetical protein